LETGDTEGERGLFAIHPRARPKLQLIGRQIPALVVDDIFADPVALRRHALALEYRPPDYYYPGKLASADSEDRSLQPFLQTVLALVNQEYLGRIPPISGGGNPITAFARIHADFAITDVHPGELQATQRIPHTDPVPIFGLVYLNEVDRGGTMFFRHAEAGAAPEQRQGYFEAGNSGFDFIGKIEGLFNRLAIYPGFVPHSGEITGDWISTDARFTSPRLTLRLAFLP
jgi:hypothetical protein